jgi:hypothetical protein
MAYNLFLSVIQGQHCDNITSDSERPFDKAHWQLLTCSALESTIFANKSVGHSMFTPSLSGR